MADSRRFFAAWLLAAVVVTVGVPAAIVWWLLFGGDDPAAYLPTIDSLPAPSAWEVQHTQAVRSLDGGPRAYRWYLVDAEPQDIAPSIKEVLQSAGLELYTPIADSDWCDSRPIGATPAITCPRKEIPTCRENGRGGPVSCSIVAFRWLSEDASLVERVSVSVSPRNDTADVGVGDEHQLQQASNRALVVVAVDHVQARTLWASPTPLRSRAP